MEDQLFTTPELAEEICTTIACFSKGIKKLCKENNEWPCADTIFQWIKENKDFSDQYARAKMHQMEVLMDEILEIADRDGDVNRDRLAIDTRKWLASKLMPKIYGNKMNS